jgi:adenylate cyclase
MAQQRKLAAILVSDVVGFSRLTGVDEDRTLARLRALRSDLIDPTIAVHQGRVVKRTGDGSLVEFRSVVDAVRCAIEVQNAMVERNAGLPPDRRIEFRVGIHLGDVVEESDGDLMGDGVNIAARLQTIAQPGTICLSEDAYRQVKSRLDLSVSDLGERTLKNIAEPLHVYSLQVGAATQIKAVRGAPTSAKPAAPPDKPSVAVLAFNNMSADAEQEYFSDGISEDIITDLSKLAELHVIARNSSFVYKGRAVSVPDIARELDVRYVLEGSVRRAGNRVRVTAQLIDATTGGHIWANRFDRNLDDIFAVQDELTQSIVTALKLKLTAREQARLGQGRSGSIEAYELLLRGREQWMQHTRAGNVAAHGLLEQALALQPRYAAAEALIACTHVNDYVMDFTDEPEHSLRTGLAMAENAVATDADEPLAHFALSMALLWTRDHDRAIAESARCLALSPSSSEAHLCNAHAHLYAGVPEIALEKISAYMRLDPHYPEIALYFLAEAQFMLGDYVSAVASLDQRLQRNPQSETTYALLASCYGHMGRRDDCRRAWERVLRLNPSFSIERRRRILPFKNPVDFEKRVEGLRKGGVAV